MVCDDWPDAATENKPARKQDNSALIESQHLELANYSLDVSALQKIASYSRPMPDNPLTGEVKC